MLARLCLTALAATLFAPSPAAAQPSGATSKNASLDSIIVGLEQRGWEAVKRKDASAFFKVAGPGFLYIQPGGVSRVSQADSPNIFATCETRSYAMDSVRVTPVGERGAVLTYRLTLDQT
jgi:hypothetical protein